MLARSARLESNSSPEECVNSGSGVHERVSQDGRRVAHRVASLHGILDPLEDEQIGVVVAREELQVERDRGLAAQNRLELRPAFLENRLETGV
eukprot:5168729-Pyramimonas_sp.AAC.1